MHCPTASYVKRHWEIESEFACIEGRPEKLPTCELQRVSFNCSVVKSEQLRYHTTLPHCKGATE